MLPRAGLSPVTDEPGSRGCCALRGGNRRRPEKPCRANERDARNDEPDRTKRMLSQVLELVNQ
jgi:hypothetical protein